MDISVKLEPEDCTVLEGLHACGNVDDRTVELLVKEEPTTWVVAEASDAEASVTMEVSDESSKASIKELTEPLKMGNEAIMDDNFEVSHIATVKVKPIDEGKIQPDLQTITMEQGLLRKRNKEQDIKYELLDTCSVTCCSESESKNHFNEVMLMVSLQENDRNNEKGSPHSPCQNVLVPLALRQSSKRGRNQHERRDDKITDQEKEEDEEMESLPIHFQSESLASCGKTSSKSSLSKHQQCDVCLELLSEEMKLIVHRRNQVSIQHCNTAASESQMKPRALSRVLRKPYKCRSYLPSCPVTFSTKDKLQKHTLPHKSSCPINCSICQKLFFFEGQLGQHVKIHEHLQHLQCEHCPETLQNSSEDKYHKGQMHSIKSFQCNPKMAQEHRGKTCSPCETVPSTVICASKWITQKIPHVSLKSFQCGSCSAEFPTYKLLKVHCRNHQAQVLDSKGKISSKPKTHKCPHCEVQFQAGKNLTSHMKVHSQIKPYKCNHCSAAFVRHSDLKRHLKTHSGEKDFKCDLCHSAFADSCKLKIHMRIHTGERPYKCELCPEAFSQSSQFERHKRVHNGDKPYKCQHCPSAFTMTSDYRRHQKIHSGERPFMCEYCPACFPEAKNLRIHMRTHTGEKPYKCELCPAAFAQAANLKRHMKSHTGERPAKCELCPSAFPDSHKLRVHMRSHNGDKPYKCKLCSSTFATSSALNRHIIVHSGEKPFKCEQCPASFAHMSKLKHHEICHSNKGSFKCEQCTASFYNVHGLTVHSHLHD